jgi:ribonuclease E
VESHFAEDKTPTIPEEVVIKQSIAVAEKTKTAAVASTQTRAGNDPRLAPKPIGQIQILTEKMELVAASPLDTRLPPLVAHNPRRIQRPQNDPRTAKSGHSE